MSLADELSKLQRLHDAGTLTAEEFQLAKDKLLNAPGVGHSSDGSETAAPVPSPPTGAANFNVLQDVDPDVTRIAEKMVNFQGILSVLFLVAFIIVAATVALVACGVGQVASPVDQMCQHSGVVCQD